MRLLRCCAAVSLVICGCGPAGNQPGDAGGEDAAVPDGAADSALEVTYSEKEVVGMSTNDTPDTGESINPLPQVVAGVSGPPTGDADAGTKSGDIDFYCFTAAAGEILTVHVQPAEGSPAQPALAIVSKVDGDYIRFAHPDATHISQRQAYLPVAGSYCVGVVDESFFSDTPMGGADYAYLLSVAKSPFAATDQPVSLPYMVSGASVPANTPITILPFTPPASSAIEARTTAHDLPTPSDVNTVLYIVDQTQAVLQQNDDIGPGVAGVTPPSDPDSLIRYLASASPQLSYLVVDYVEIGALRQNDLSLVNYAPSAEREANDARTMANPIFAPGATSTTTVTGTIDRKDAMGVQNGDRDYFVFDGTAGDYFEITVTPGVTAPTNFVPALAFFDLDLNAFFENPNLVKQLPGRLEGWALESRPYVIRVTNNDDGGAPVGGANFSYTLSVKKITRTAISLGTLPLAGLANPAQIDQAGAMRWYGFTVPASGGVYSVEPDLGMRAGDATDGAKVNTQMVLVGNDGKTVLAAGNLWLLDQIYLAAGSYNLGFGDAAGSSGATAHLLRASIAAATTVPATETAGTNDTQAMAQNLGAPTIAAPKMVTGTLTAGDRDWYSIGSNAVNSHLLIQTTFGAKGSMVPPVGTKLYLVNAGGTVVASDEAGNANSSLIFDVAQAGVYSVRVEGADATATGDYGLLVRRMPCALSDAAGQLSGADLGVNEVLGGSGTNRFVEVVNFSGTPINVQGFHIRGKDPTAGNLYTLCPSADLDKVYVACSSTGTPASCSAHLATMPALSTSTADTAILFDWAGYGIDKLYYVGSGTNSFDHVTLGGTAGATCDAPAPSSLSAIANNTCKNGVGNSSPGKKADGTAF